MMNNFRVLPSFLAFLATITFLMGGASNANWPQWRGPDLNGSTSTARDLAVSWDQTRNVRWRAKLPSWSAATPVVWDDTIFVTSAEEGFASLVEGSVPVSGSLDRDKIFLLAVNRKDGSIRWQKQIDIGNKLYRKQNSASLSPITDGKHVWIMTGNGIFACFTLEGREVWKRDIQAEYGRFGLNHGYASTPLLIGDRLYVQVLHGMKTDDPSYVFAADKDSGKTLWKVERPTDAIGESPDNYATPQIASVSGKLQLVVSGGDYVTGHDMDNGRELWRIGGFNPNKNSFNRTIASSLVIGDNVFASGNRGRPFIGFRAGGSGDITGKNELWTNDLGADVPTPTTDGKFIYVLRDNGTMNCLEALTGKIVYESKRIEMGTYSSSPLLADGKLYCINEEGTTTVVKAGASFEILGVNRLDSHTLASPVAADNQIFVRTGNYLYCIQKGEGKQAGNETIAEFEPALAIRGSACITCHARIRSTIITDFGYGDSYFWGVSEGGGSLGPFNGSIYGDFYGAEPNKTAWGTAQIDGGIIVPRTRFTFNLRAAAGRNLENQPAYQQALDASSLAQYLQAVEKQKTNPSTVTEKESVFIGAPNAATLEERFQIPPGSGIKFKYIKSNAGSPPDVKGIEFNSAGSYFTNTKEIECDGDLFIRGTLFLNRATVSTQNGCRIYATGPIFLQNEITYTNRENSADRANLQLVSAQAILLGVGDKSCDAADKESPLSRRLVSGYAISTFFTRDAHGKSIAPKKTGQAIYDQGRLIPLLEDASCRDSTVNFSRLLLDAPQVHSRYRGKFTGLVIAEIALFRLGSSDFEFDPVFREVPVLPILKNSDYLEVGVPGRVGAKSEKPEEKAK